MAILEPSFPKSPFNPVEDPFEQKSLVDEAIKSSIPLVVWTKKKEILLENVKLISYEEGKGFQVETKNLPESRKFLEYVTIKQDLVFFNFGVWRCGVFITAAFDRENMESKKAFFHFHAPKDFFKVQRRIALRIPIKAPYLLLAEIRVPGSMLPVQRRISDLSVGGLSIVTTPSEADQFKKGQIISELKIVLRSRQLNVSAEVRHTRLVNRDKLPQLLVGLKLIEPSKKDIQVLETFVSEESQTQFTSFVKR